MKGILVQTTLHGRRDLDKIIESNVIGENSKPLGSQFPSFENIPLAFCSYVCEGYQETYGNREGIIFETDSPVLYACPVDSFELMRGGNWLPGYERFIFPSIEAMLRRYPTSSDFKKDFQEFFARLNPFEVYPNNSKEFAELHHRLDYCLSRRPIWNPGCNEITFHKPFNVRNCRIFNSKEELKQFYQK